MEKKIVYGVFAIEVKAPEKSNGKQEVMDVADSMRELSELKQAAEGRFVRAYEKLSNAVEKCYEANGQMLKNTIDCPDGITDKGRCHTYYFPRIIEIL